jgi:hypothetical protein
MLIKFVIASRALTRDLTRNPLKTVHPHFYK